MSDRPIAFEDPPPDRCGDLIVTKHVQIIAGSTAVGEFEFNSPGIHNWAAAPPRMTIIPMSTEGRMLRDVTWQPHTIGYLPSGMTQSGMIVETAPATWVAISDQLYRQVANENIDVAKLHHRVQLGASDPVSSHLIRAMGEVAKNGNSIVWPLLVESLATALMVRTMQLMGARPATGAPYGEGLPRERLNRVLEYIEANIVRQIGLSELAAVAALSPHHFARSFQKAMNVAPVRYVWNRRIERAKTGLKDRSTPLSSIAYDCGFSSQSHFTTLFKKMVGMTPAKYRSQLRALLYGSPLLPLVAEHPFLGAIMAA